MRRPSSGGLELYAEEKADSTALELYGKKKIDSTALLYNPRSAKYTEAVQIHRREAINQSLVQRGRILVMLCILNFPLRFFSDFEKQTQPLCEL